MKTAIENKLLEIVVDIQTELLRQCKRHNCDDWQTDGINENVIGVFDLNKQKYIREIEDLITIKQI